MDSADCLVLLWDTGDDDLVTLLRAYPWRGSRLGVWMKKGSWDEVW